MNILCVGDSWTAGFDVEQQNTWPMILQQLTGHQVTVHAFCGADNESITRMCDQYESEPDLVIVGWSGVTRIIESEYPNYKQFSLSYVPDENTPARDAWFKQYSLDDILELWHEQISRVNARFGAHRVLMFSVFGDQTKYPIPNMLDTSALEYIASKQGTVFNYSIPIFEFDFLHENNSAISYIEHELGPNWQYACAEREMLRNTQLFQNCGHPNAQGYQHFARYLAEKLQQNQAVN